MPDTTASYESANDHMGPNSYAWEKAGRIWYESLANKSLKQTAQFRDFARLTLTTARDLYGPESDETRAVSRGWELVGIPLAGRARARKATN